MCMVSVLQVQTEAPRAAMADGGNVSLHVVPVLQVQTGAPRRARHTGGIFGIATSVAIVVAQMAFHRFGTRCPQGLTD